MRKLHIVATEIMGYNGVKCKEAKHMHEIKKVKFNTKKILYLIEKLKAKCIICDK